MLTGIFRTRTKGRRHETPPRAFTLIELLIVVAIIAILAAIAVPNFLEAQVRAKISRVHSDMRTISVAIEMYTVDNNRPPIGSAEMVEPANGGNAVLPTYWQTSKEAKRWRLLTSPIAYMTIEPRDPFGFRIQNDGVTQSRNQYPRYSYNCSLWRHWMGSTVEQPRGNNHRKARAAGLNWFMNSRGPSRRNRTVADPNQANGLLMACLGYPNNANLRYPDIFYDTTNGTRSFGRIVRSSRGIEPQVSGVRQ